MIHENCQYQANGGTIVRAALSAFYRDADHDVVMLDFYNETLQRKDYITFKNREEFLHFARMCLRFDELLVGLKGA